MVVAALASPDAVNLDVLGRYPLPLRWDNVRGAPQWVAGVKPVPTAGNGDAVNQESRWFYQVRLPPGASTTVWIPANESLRVYRSGGRLDPQDLQFMVANGSGLLVGAAAQRSAQGDSLLLPPDGSEERLARIRRPATATGSLEVALFISRRDALSEPAPYRNRVAVSARSPTAKDPSLPMTPVWLRPSDQATAQPYWSLPAQPPLRLTVQGPLRLALEHRVRYPLTETQTRQDYRIYAHLNGRPWQALDFVVGPEMRRVIWVDGCAETLGRLETGYLELPAGSHELTLTATLPLYFRLLAQDDPDYLFPDLNAPRWRAAAARAARSVEHGSIWDLTPAQLARPLERMTLAEEERTALRLGRDNHYRDGGLTAALASQQAALAHREAPRLSPQAQDLIGHFTLFRNVLPINKPSRVPQQFAW
ncbi:MAG: hypothetical protein KDI50_12650, partial [Candidatus Competibacteraceae bacterium]|nr:hypothetical protein [Candidatus Competibacteraceae bacterium]